MSLANTREKRYNAGNRMNRMLEEEQEDDFYKTTYGGFEEESGDEEYSSDDSEHDSPSSDSDISAPEDDELISDDEDGNPKRKMRVVTKAYKEPAKKPTPKLSTSSDSKEKKAKPKETARSRRRQQLQQYAEDMDFDIDDDIRVRKSRRSTTVMKNTEFKMRMQEREAKAKELKAYNARRPTQQVRRMTQQELLREAKITEKKNLASLEMYHKLEAERKKTKVRKKAFIGAYVRYHSMSMPVVQPPKVHPPVVQPPIVQPPIVQPVQQPVISQSVVMLVVQPGQQTVPQPIVQPDVQPVQPQPTETVPNIVTNVEHVNVKSSSPPKSTVQRCTRNFITFSDEKLYHEAFPKKTLKTRSRPAKHVCPVTRQPAKYLDPITNIPYANKSAFKIIRDTYIPELEQQMKNKKAKKRESAS